MLFPYLSALPLPSSLPLRCLLLEGLTLPRVRLPSPLPYNLSLFWKDFVLWHR
jgi:hypothetical protein